ncbi:hypothetical protein PTKU64_82840 [Paraburkholderia terrae]|uniref:Uncharacterized protein n=1 Tax=Paraburkholderia terrae TaxID=311230 RepID=A0ABM7U0D0_9BURK|nr:hypothetical protein PTKU64_82840 [Paraburkholderia terrae]BDC45858.1 hypothetical protein PTKU15_91550 [Paraburkholderia terrae]
MKPSAKARPPDRTGALGSQHSKRAGRHLPGALEQCVDDWRIHLPAALLSLNIKGDFAGLSDTLNIILYRLVQEGPDKRVEIRPRSAR